MSEPVRILCIEDNAMNWRLVQRLLSQAGYEMHWAEDGLKGFELAVSLRPALILLDINLPGLSGFEVATKLRQSPELEGVLIVALTARTMRSDRETALVTGCDGFISKPIDPFLFVGQVEAYLGGRRDRLDQEREGAALRQFSRQVVDHLEAQLRQVQESNQQLLETQAALEARNTMLSRLLALGRDLVSIREGKEIQALALRQLGDDLGLDRLGIYRLHSSGGYVQGLVWEAGEVRESAVIPVDHPLLLRLTALPDGAPVFGRDLTQSALWDPAVELGLWDTRWEALLLPFRGQSGAPVQGLLAAGRAGRAFQPFEVEITALHAELVSVTLQNADLIHNLDETSRALGSSYERLESAYAELQKAQKALDVQDRKAALGSLFMSMAQRLRDPVKVLQAETVALESFMNRAEVPPPEDREQCHRSLSEIHQAIEDVEGLVRALLRRAGPGEAGMPEWIHLHGLIRQELDLMTSEGGFPPHLATEVNLQAGRDLIFGVYQDFAEILGNLASHVVGGGCTRVSLRTWGGTSHFRLEMEDDGAQIPQELLATAFEPFSGLRDRAHGGERHPGAGLPACAQLIGTYRGTVEIENTPTGTRVRLSLPLD